MGLALVISACGGSDADASDKPTKTAATSATPRPTPTVAATPSPTVAPLSPFEDRAPVKAARNFEVVLSQAVNARERSLASLVPLTTGHGMQLARYIAHIDLSHRWLRPGPEPFTPVGVHVEGAVAKVDICLQYAGWSVDRTTHARVDRRKVAPAVYQFRKVAGAWKFDDYYARTGSCTGVRVRGVRW